MWIKMLKTYSGPLGLFAGGQKKDLPEEVVKQFPKDYFEVTCAPWDEFKDTDLTELNRLKAEHKKIATNIDNLKQNIIDHKGHAKQLLEHVEVYQKQVDSGNEEADKLAGQIQKLESKIAAKKETARKKAEAEAKTKTEKDAADVKDAAEKAKAAKEKSEKSKIDLEKRAVAAGKGAAGKVLGALGVSQNAGKKKRHP